MVSRTRHSTRSRSDSSQVCGTEAAKIRCMSRSRKSGMLKLCRSAVLVIITCTVLTAAKGYSQTAASSGSGKPLGWDVVSVKSVQYNGVISHSTGRFDGYSVMMPLEQLISQAYGVRQGLISGSPAWASTAQYAIEAKVAPADVVEYRKLSQKQRDLMLQSILTERFKLTAHGEMRQLPVYELVVAKQAKLQQAQSGSGGSSAGPGMINCKNCPVSVPGGHVVAEFAARRSGSHRPHWNVRHQTAMVGLDWAHRFLPRWEEQLGLKLNSAKGPVKTLVVDHVERPSEN